MPAQNTAKRLVSRNIRRKELRQDRDDRVLMVNPDLLLLFATGHRCHCRDCSPDFYPEGTKPLGDHHFAVRYGAAALKIFATLDGKVVGGATEVLVGEAGRVWSFTNPRHVCNCPRPPNATPRACEVVQEGNVGVVDAATFRPRLVD